MSYTLSFTLESNPQILARVSEELTLVLAYFEQKSIRWYLSLFYANKLFSADAATKYRNSVLMTPNPPLKGRIVLQNLGLKNILNLVHFNHQVLSRTFKPLGLIRLWLKSPGWILGLESSGLKTRVEKFRVEMFFNLSFKARWTSSSSFFLKISDFSYSCWLRRKAWPNISSLSLLSSAFCAQDFGGDDGLEPVSFQKKYFNFYTGKFLLINYKNDKRSR